MEVFPLHEPFLNRAHRCSRGGPENSARFWSAATKLAESPLSGSKKKPGVVGRTITLDQPTPKAVTSLRSVTAVHNAAGTPQARDSIVLNRPATPFAEPFVVLNGGVSMGVRGTTGGNKGSSNQLEELELPPSQNGQTARVIQSFVPQMGQE